MIIWLKERQRWRRPVKPVVTTTTDLWVIVQAIEMGGDAAVNIVGRPGSENVLVRTAEEQHPGEVGRSCVCEAILPEFYLPFMVCDFVHSSIFK